MSAIATNVSALKAQNTLASNARTMNAAMQQLSSGNRVNSAADDAAGLAIGQTMTSQIRGLNQAVRNANDGVNMLQTAEGAMVEQTNMLQRMRELAVQSANSTNSKEQRDYLNNEFQQLGSQIGAIGDQTMWNSTHVLDAGTMKFQVGSLSGQTISLALSSVSLSGLSIVSEVVTTPPGTGAVATTATTMLTIAGSTGSAASAALDTLDNALTTINSQRSKIGATINRLTYAADNLSNTSSNLSASRSAIMDTDYATASSQLSKNQIIQQAATAMLAQANQQPQSVLSLLK